MGRLHIQLQTPASKCPPSPAQGPPSPVLGAHIAALAVEGGGVVPRPKHIQQLLVGGLQFRSTTNT